MRAFKLKSCSLFCSLYTRSFTLCSFQFTTSESGVGKLYWIGDEIPKQKAMLAIKASLKPT